MGTTSSPPAQVKPVFSDAHEIESVAVCDDRGQLLDRPDHMPQDDRVGHGLVDIRVSAVKAPVAADRVSAVVHKELAGQPRFLIGD